MTLVVPTGAPSWTRTATHEAYGGSVSKQNYLDRRGIDALTDVSAEQFCRLTADTTATVRTLPFCTISWTCRDTDTVIARGDPGYGLVPLHVPLVTHVSGQAFGFPNPYYGDRAPAGMPSLTRVSDGKVEITFASSYRDPYGVEAAWSISQIAPSAFGNPDYFPLTTVVSGHVLQIAIVNKSSVPIQDALASLTVW